MDCCSRANCCRETDCVCTKTRFRNFIVILSLCIAMFCGSYTGSYVFSFLPEMIVWFGYTEVEKATYSGVIASLYYFGMGITGYMWGRLSDKYGRRLILVVSLVLNGFVCMFLGLSVHVAMAIVFRFLNGAVDCVYVIINCTIAEQFPMDFQPTAQVVLHVALSLGTTIGPGIAGFLSSPCVKYPNRFPDEGFFHNFPFFLPGVLGLGINLIGAVLVTIFYPQMTRRAYDILEGNNDQSMASTKSDEQTNDYSKDEIDKIKDSNIDDDASKVAGSKKETPIDEESFSRDESEEISIAKKKVANYGTDKEMIIQEEADGNDLGCWARCQASDFVKLFNYSEAVVLVCTLSLLLFSVIGHAEIFTVWCSTKVELGGLSLRSDKIGLILAISIIPAYVITFLTFVNLQKKVGDTITFQIYGVIFLAFLTGLPCCRFIKDREVQWGIVLLVKIFLQMSCNCCFTVISFLINNSVPPEHLGGINGVSMLMSSIPMALAPNIAGAIFRGSIQHGFESSIDSSLVFVIFGITTWICCIAIYVRPPRYSSEETLAVDTVKNDAPKTDREENVSIKGELSSAEHSVIVHREGTAAVGHENKNKDGS